MCTAISSSIVRSTLNDLTPSLLPEALAMLSCHLRSADLLFLGCVAVDNTMLWHQVAETTPIITIGKALVGLGCYFVVLQVTS